MSASEYRWTQGRVPDKPGYYWLDIGVSAPVMVRQYGDGARQYLDDQPYFCRLKPGEPGEWTEHSRWQRVRVPSCARVST